MDLKRFRSSLGDTAPPAGLSGPLAALWHDANDDWDEAHRAVQSESGPQAAWVHAYLHRKEGDASNARYWYRRAGRPPSAAALGEEWEAIAAHLCADL